MRVINRIEVFRGDGSRGREMLIRGWDWIRTGFGMGCCTVNKPVVVFRSSDSQGTEIDSLNELKMRQFFRRIIHLGGGQEHIGLTKLVKAEGGTPIHIIYNNYTCSTIG